MVKFTAKHDGQCGRCSQPIIIGQHIAWDRTKCGVYFHVDCAKPAAIIPPMDIDEIDLADSAKPSPDVQAALAALTSAVAASVPRPAAGLDPRVDSLAQRLLTLEARPYGIGAEDIVRVSLATKDLLLPSVAEVASAALNQSVQAILEDSRAEARNAASKVLDQAASILVKGEAAIAERIKDIGILRIEITQIDRQDIVLDESCHEAFEQVLAYARERRHVYLWGPPGSGKSHLSRQVAKALSLEWSFDALVPETFESTLVGFYSATGAYITTNLRKRYEGGGVHCFDELDNSSARLQARLNSALANGHGAFPDGMILRHPDFVCVATGNTRGRGGDPVFPERRRMDPAFLDRFLPIHIGYDGALERKLATAYAEGRNEGMGKLGLAWAKHVQATREYSAKKHPQILITPRASYDGALLLAAGRDVVEVSAAVMYRTWDESAVTDIKANVKPFQS